MIEILLGVTPKGCRAEETQREGFSQEKERVYEQRQERNQGSRSGCVTAAVQG